MMAGDTVLDLVAKIMTKLHERPIALTEAPSGYADLNTRVHTAQQALKDPYLFDFLTLEDSFHERELAGGAHS